MGYDFQSDIHFYEVPGNANGKMSQRVYIDQILQPIVKPWIEAHYDFVLEEDGDSGHGPGKSNVVRTWKETNSTSTVTHHQTLPLSKTAGNQLNNIFINIRIGMIILRKS